MILYFLGFDFLIHSVLKTCLVPYLLSALFVFICSHSHCSHQFRPRRAANSNLWPCKHYFVFWWTSLKSEVVQQLSFCSTQIDILLWTQKKVSQPTPWDSFVFSLWRIIDSTSILSKVNITRFLVFNIYASFFVRHILWSFRGMQEK